MVLVNDLTPVIGLSPRVGLTRTCHRAVGSIPACAGEPVENIIMASAITVYPRVCGGTESLERDEGRILGLSPRVRGNHPALGLRDAMRRSIPACAGEPESWRRVGDRRRVYPRVCGGTTTGPRCGRSRHGLSPRVRGNPAIWAENRSGIGSIPACAGEPPCSSPSSRPCGVYPRVCGGTCARNAAGDAYEGLSPRVRGNPFRGRLDCTWSRVYPRVCGGTLNSRGINPTY